MRMLASVLLSLFAIMCSASMRPQASIAQEFQDLQDERTTDNAAKQLKESAGADANARAFVSQHLPVLIEKAPAGRIWLNAVRLAGELKIVETVPVLAAALQGDNSGGPTTFAEEQRLDNDPVGKSLAQIGDPACGAVAEILTQGDTSARWRATLVLLNINSDKSRQILQNHVPKESDRNLQKLIRNRLGLQRNAPDVRGGS